MDRIEYTAVSSGQARRWAALASWLAERGFGPDVVASSEASSSTLITHRPAGIPANDPERHGAIKELAEMMGESLRLLHATDPEGIDGPSGWEAIRDQVRASSVDPRDLPDPYRRYDRERLITLWEESRPADEALVVCHGAARLDNFFVSEGEPIGWVQPTRLVIADRHLDLAVAHRSVGTVLGNDAVYAFYEAYGSDPSLVALEHYLLAELLTPVRVPNTLAGPSSESV